jgi:NAD(P)-dependent dehydrogenase (short-subunit alcohol dehydrogenase family)
MGVDFVKAALAAGHAVVASGRDRDGVAKALGQSDDLLAVKLDVTERGDAEAAVRTAVDRFGRIDVLVNNAASFYAGYFEELTPEQMDRQLATSLIGPMNVTRAVLPVMRKQREGADRRAPGPLDIPRSRARARRTGRVGKEGHRQQLTHDRSEQEDPQ